MEQHDYGKCDFLDQQYGREFWSTAIAFDPFPSIDEPKKRPLKEFLIKFLVLNGQRTLTLDFNTFCSSTDLNYNNGKYVDHPKPEVVKKELGKITINPSYLDKTPVLKNSFPVAWRILFNFMIQGPEASGALSKKNKRPNSKKPPTETKVTSPNPTKGSEQSHSVSSGTLPDPQDLNRDIQLASTGLPSTLDDGIRKSKPLLEGGNKPPADMALQNPNDADLSGTGAKYQEDQTQSSRLRCSSYSSLRMRLRKVRKTFWELEKHEEAVVHYVNLKASIDDYYKENMAYGDQTDKLVEASMSSLEKSSATINDLYKGMKVITQLLKDITKSVKDDPTTNKKIEEASETLAKISTQTSKILSLVRSFNFFTLQSTAQPITIIHPEPSIPQKEGKGIATDNQVEDQRKLVKASFIVRLDLDEPVRVEFVINRETFYLTEQEIQEYWVKEEEIKKAEEEDRLNPISKTEVIKVVHEEAKKLGIHLKEAITTKAGELFKKARNAEHKVLKRQHTEKVRKSLELRKHKYDTYMWTVSSRLKPEPIMYIKIHQKTKPVVITLYRGTDGRNFNVYKPFLFRAFGISKLDKLREIIPKKKNTLVKELMNSLSQRKWKHVELEPKTRISGLECNRDLPENVPFVNNMVIKEPEYEISFTDEFAASMVKSPKNARFSMKLGKLIAEHRDQEKLKSKKVKLEAPGYKMD
uniref:Retrovirus-related Pol polyprotein from transposon TNT 1-94 n=1 Tax=Tanacetum cinerariifolium TaxID=118510 RepID=A0A6L2K214_TANCI|nr:hypothetical protein [Tanacetum cinerariifolium]